MSVSITSHRRRLVTVLVPQGDGVRPVRIAYGHTAHGLPDAVLDLPMVKAAQASGEFVVLRERSIERTRGAR